MSFIMSSLQCGRFVLFILLCIAMIVSLSYVRSEYYWKSHLGDELSIKPDAVEPVEDYYPPDEFGHEDYRKPFAPGSKP